eukprot:5679629-Amphidinium_carterae.1
MFLKQFCSSMWTEVQLTGDEADKNEEMVVLSLLDDSHQVVATAQELNNCAATYVSDVRRKRCAAVRAVNSKSTQE